MNDIITTAQLPTFLLLVLPGFIATRVFDLLVPGERRVAGRQLLDSLAYGTLNLGLWFVPLNHVVLPRRENLWIFYPFTFAMLVVSPVIIAWLTRFILTRRAMRRAFRHPCPTAWDYFFDKREPAWVLVHLKSGKLVGGWYGVNSFASSYPERDLYLEQVWNIDDRGRFLLPQVGSSGVILSMADCELIEFFAEEGALDNAAGTHSTDRNH